MLQRKNLELAPYNGKRNELIISEQTSLVPWEGGDSVSHFPVFLAPQTTPSLWSCSNFLLNEIYSNKARANRL